MTPRPPGRVRQRLAAAARDDDGFTLLEVVVSFLLFSVVAAGATTAIVSALQASHRSQQRVDAANVAQLFIATSLQNAQAAANGSTTYPYLGVKNEDFTVKRTVTFDNGATTCSPGASFKVNVEVYQKQTNAFLARSDTVITC